MDGVGRAGEEQAGEGRNRRGREAPGPGTAHALTHAAHPAGERRAPVRREYFMAPEVPPHDPLRARNRPRPAERRRAAEPGDKLVHAGERPPPGDRGDRGDGRWDEFWRERPDEDDPEARISLRWLVRVALIFGLVLLAGGLTWSVVNSRQAATTPQAAPEPAPATQEPPDQEATPAQKATPDQKTTPEEPPTGATVKKALPAPRPPTARLSPASVQLGKGRTGTFALTCTGTCRVTSFTGTNGVVVEGNTFTVRAPAARPGCSGPPVTESGVVTIGWSGTVTGDGETTEGTVTGDGTLSMIVSWTVTTNRGAFIPDTNGGSYWSNCPKGE
jgi:hypothetical protein